MGSGRRESKLFGYVNDEYQVIEKGTAFNQKSEGGRLYLST